jgi:hypothetical protein
METNLRPLSLGEILDRTAQLYRTNFLLFAGIESAYAGAVLVINLASLGVLEGFKATGFAASMTWERQLFSWCSLLVMLIVSNVAAAAVNRAVAWVHLGEPASITRAYQSILPRVGRYLGLGTLKLLFAWTPLLLIYGAFIASFAHYQIKGVLPQPGQMPQPGAPPNPEALVFGVITLVFGVVIWPVLIFGVFMALRYALALPASVVENLTVRAAMRRSVLLSKEGRGRVFVLWLLVIVVEFMVIGVTQAFFVAYSLRHHYQVPVGLQIVQQILGFFTNTFVGPILAIGTTLIYYDQRVRKEGYDIEWMMAAAGLAGGASGIPGNTEPAGPLEPQQAGALQTAPETIGQGDGA